MRIGMHVRAFEAGRPVAHIKGVERGAETIQIFASSPRQWRLPLIDPGIDREFVASLRKSALKPLFIHAPYLANLCSPTKGTRSLALSRTQWTMERAFALKAAGVVVHAGSCVGTSRTLALKRLSRAIGAVIGSAPDGPQYLVELTAGGSGAVASTITDAVELLDACGGDKRIAFCVDTCHLHAAGYDLKKAKGIDELLREFATKIGIKRLALIHTNDSRDPRDSRRDRHWHIGEGSIGPGGFRALVRHPLVQKVPMICETPGQVEDDKRNIMRLKKMRDTAAK